MEKNIRVEMIKEYMTKNGYNKTDFCKACKISLKTLNLVLSDEIKILALEKIAREMKVNLLDLLKRKNATD